MTTRSIKAFFVSRSGENIRVDITLKDSYSELATPIITLWMDGVGHRCQSVEVVKS